jgi:choline dehydrogenase-like flavoprotein
MVVLKTLGQEVGMEGTRHDVIVVGSGPGGATVARELSRRRKKVLILEWGPGGPDRGTLGQYISQQAVPGKSLLLTSDLLSMVRGITTGGSSLFYYATAFPVPTEMLASHGVDIADEVAEARRELPVGPLKDEMVTPMARRIMASARELGFDWHLLDKLIDQDRWWPQHRFGYYGDPDKVKWTARAWVDEARDHGAEIRNHTRVSRVIVESGTATGVEYHWRGGLKQASAPVVVVAAGGIGSPLILRASGIEEAGFDFFFDPLITVSGMVKDVACQDNEIPMTAGALLHDHGYMMTDMPVPWLTNAIFEAQVGRLDKLARSSTARIMIKIRDGLSGQLSAGGGVRKRLSPEDRDKLMHGYANARRILEGMGARRISRSWYFASHPGGTVKIGRLVDTRLETRIANLHVCDCSVIPEAWGLPPTLTIIGLGKYLARHLTGDKQAVA